MKIILFLLLFPVLCTAVYSQTFDYSPKSSSVFKNQSQEVNLLFSAKIGYHTGYESNKQTGFNGGMIYSFTSEGSVFEETNVGCSFEFWHHTNDEYKTLEGITYPVTYTGSNINFNFTRKFRGENHSINLGLGLGMYFVHAKSNRFDISDNSYFNLKLIGGFDLRISGVLFITPQIEFNHMMGSANTSDLLSFMIGPSIIFGE